MPLIEDIELFFRDFGVSCMYDGTSFMALYDEPGAQTDLGGIQIMTTERSITYNAAAVTLEPDGTVDVDGVEYRISSDVAEPPDGKLRRAVLKKLS